jgi:hypothetical protein
MDEFLNSLIANDTSFVFYQPFKESKSVFYSINPDSLSQHNYVNIYNDYLLKPVNNFPQERSNVQPDWFFPIILLVLVVYAWLRIFYNKYFSQLIQAFLNNNLAFQIVRDENILVQRSSVYLSFVFNLISALFLYLLSNHFNWSLGDIGNGFTRFLFFVIVITGIYALKFLVLKICGWLFEQEREMATYVFNIFLINNILGMALLPFICLLSFNHSHSFTWMIFIPVILTGLAFIWRIIRGLQIGWGTASFSPLYLFLYLCTLEIAPLMILIRFIVQ